MRKLSKASSMWVEREFAKSKSEAKKRLMIEEQQLAACIELGLKVDFAPHVELIRRLKEII